MKKSPAYVRVCETVTIAHRLLNAAENMRGEAPLCCQGCTLPMCLLCVLASSLWCVCVCSHSVSFPGIFSYAGLQPLSLCLVLHPVYSALRCFFFFM